jgi:flagellar hook-associated protein 2
VSGLATAVKALDQASEGRPLSATSSDTRVSVAASSTATAGMHDLRVKQLATSKVVQSEPFSSRTTAGVVGDGGVDINVGGTVKSVAWTSSDSLDQIAAKINAADAGVTASIVDVTGSGSFRLVVNAKSSGTAKAPIFTDTGTGTLGLSNPANEKVIAKDALVNIDGIDISRPTNVISDALEGVTLTLNSVHGTDDPSNRSTVALDTKSLTDKVKAVVSAYNSINSALHVQLDYTGTTKGQNTLFGDSTLRQLQASLGSLMSNSYGGTTLSALGISRDRTGAMTLDESKLSTALTANPDAVSDLFVTKGFATAVTTLTDAYTTSTTGIFATKTQSMTDRGKAFQAQIDSINKSADDLQSRLEKQFNAMEQAMSNMKAQFSQLTAMLGV